MRKQHKKVTSEQRAARRAELERLVRTAALSIHHTGSLPLLAARAGISHQALGHAIRRGHFTVGMAAAIESVVGKEVLPKEKLLKQS